jgi:hypothetical protein
MKRPAGGGADVDSTPGQALLHRYAPKDTRNKTESQQENRLSAE